MDRGAVRMSMRQAAGVTVTRVPYHEVMSPPSDAAAFLAQTHTTLQHNHSAHFLLSRFSFATTNTSHT